MPYLLRPERWTRTPQYPVELDLRHPLARGLYFAWTPAWRPFDASRRVAINTYSPTSQYAPTEQGLRRTYSGASTIFVGTYNDASFNGGGGVPFYSRSEFTSYGLVTVGANFATRSCVFNVGTCGWACGYSNKTAIFGYVNQSTYIAETASGAFAAGVRAGYAMSWSYGRSPAAAFFRDSRLLATSAQTGSDTTTPSGSDGYTARLGGPSGAGNLQSWDGLIHAALVWNRALSYGEHQAIGENPFQIFRRDPGRVYFFPAGGVAITLTVADAAHAHSTDNVSLSQANALTLADALHGHTADSLTLTQAHVLAVADALHAHAADAVSLTQASALAVADAAHAHTVDGLLSLTVGNVLAVADTAHAHTAEAVALVQSHLLAVADALHAHAAEAVTLQSAGTLNVADASHAHTADSVSLTQASVLVVQDTTHGHTVDALSLSEGFSLAVADAIHAHAVDALTLTQAHILAVQDTAHGHLADAVSLTQANVLIVSDTLHAQLVDALTLKMPGEIGASTLFVVAAGDRILVVAHSQRYFTVH